ncbi:MAG: hypothetical protein KatS3mg095_0418 [Candidatus Parcubacteria bacterium]|nr:MAG: hypothetical protein KatS3mg095_0418 [Candidatus Parcubacteria bacterium]
MKKYDDSIIAVEKVSRRQVKNYGIISGIKIAKDIFEINDIIEKPLPSKAPSDLAIVGRYILKPDVFEILKKISPDKDGEIRLANALKDLLKTKPIYGYQFNGQRYDCGNKIGYLKATVNFALKHQEVKKDFKKFLNNLFDN